MFLLPDGLAAQSRDDILASIPNNRVTRAAVGEKGALVFG